MKTEMVYLPGRGEPLVFSRERAAAGFASAQNPNPAPREVTQTPCDSSSYEQPQRWRSTAVGPPGKEQSPPET
ncbi:hypothetical protein DM860_005563 [Cuscuta australis]|uniref:Uncharacterized protein n=1 Tax=Cuscuta australis TaxID=267555 RepID=A0A328DUR0_9ASTE|nr:hypothetical protein DM860_005563 [Cuscuta australis]